MSIKSLACSFLSLILIMISAVECCADGVRADSVRGQIDGNTPTLIAVSKYGDTVSYPENSSAGVCAAAENGADMVLVKIKKTADGVLVLFGDDSLERMCVDADGNPVKKMISQVTFDELSSYRLRLSHGGEGQSVTAYTVSSLYDTVRELDGRALLLIDGWEYREEIAGLLDEADSKRVVLIADGEKRELFNEWLNKDRSPSVFARYKGNIIWSCVSYIKKSAVKGAQGVILASSNPYSVAFSSGVVSKAQAEIRAVIDMTDKKLCGKRDDTSVYWDDVTSRGFSVIITDDIKGLLLYRNRVELSRERLSLLIEKASAVNTDSLSIITGNRFNALLRKAVKTADESVSAMKLDNCYSELNNMLTQIYEGGSVGVLTVSAGRVAVAVAVTAAFVFFELLIARVRNKRIILRRRGIDKKERYRLKNKE